MAKKITKKIKIIAPAGKATPAPPLGTTLGPAGINIGEFVKRFNEATLPMIGNLIPCIITIYDDRSYDFVLKTPPASGLIMKMINAEKGSGKPNTAKVGTLTKAQLREIASIAGIRGTGATHRYCDMMRTASRQGRRRCDQHIPRQ